MENDRRDKRDDLPVLAISPDDFPHVFGIPRTKVFEAMRTGKLAAKKDGKRTLITIEEGQRYIDSLPNREIKRGRSAA